MAFYWLNCFNMVEFDGPFKTADAARKNAVKTFKAIQNGIALHVAVVEHDSSKQPKYLESASERGSRISDLTTGKIVYEGHIEGGKWGDGPSPRFPSTL